MKKIKFRMAVSLPGLGEFQPGDTVDANSVAAWAESLIQTKAAEVVGAEENKPGVTDAVEKTGL